jgi:two-component system nitrate/nitrite response regulator NarP
VTAFLYGYQRIIFALVIAPKIHYPVRVGVVDKNQLVVRGLRTIFDEDGRFDLVASAHDGARLLDGLGMLSLDIVITGWLMPYCNGRELLEILATRADSPKVVVYTGHTDDLVPRQAMELGAYAFFSKSEPPERLLNVLDSVARGSMVFPFMSKQSEVSVLKQLTQKESLMLEKLCLGMTNQELAAAMNVSPNTVKFHLRNIYSKLNVRNRAEAVALYFSEGNFAS